MSASFQPTQDRCLQPHEFTAPFNVWQRELEERCDVFLGYCGASAATAHAIKRYLSEQGVTVLDWQTDFPPGQNILQLIGRASDRCGAGIFHFTRDDELAALGEEHEAVPRDKVVFQSGPFHPHQGEGPCARGARRRRQDACRSRRRHLRCAARPPPHRPHPGQLAALRARVVELRDPRDDFSSPAGRRTRPARGATRVAAPGYTAEARFSDDREASAASDTLVAE